MTEAVNPAAEFNVEDWLTDAAMPEASATIYKRADVIGELTVLKDQIELRAKANELEKTAHGDTVMANYQRRYEELVKTFAESELTIYVRALDPDHLKDIRDESEARTKDLESDAQNEDMGYSVLSAAIVAVRPFEGERVDVTWTRQQVKDIEKRIGTTQMKQVLSARLTAQNGLPRVDADFLHRLSGSEAGQE